MNVFLGIDTSCYTTSVALVNEAAEVVAEERRLLHIPLGKSGLPQNKMVFQHVRALPELLKNVLASSDMTIRAIGSSAMPRRREGSYMPAFVVGKGFGESLAAALNLPFFAFSHQENHVFAALREYPFLWGRNFYMLHLSGGTTDWLDVSWEEDRPVVQELASTSDLTAGQLVDRIGVLLGMPFPSGPHLEKLALTCSDISTYSLPLPKNSSVISFAGAETALRRALASGTIDAPTAATALFDFIRRSLQRTVCSGILTAGKTLVAVGGVMTNRYLRQGLIDACEKATLNIVFSAPHYSSDNATGNAYGALRLWKSGR